jgi:hypothetical protein
MRHPTVPSRLLCDPDKRRRLAYRPAAATDIRATFKRARAEQAKTTTTEAPTAQKPTDEPVPAPVTWLRRSRGA